MALLPDQSRASVVLTTVSTDNRNHEERADE